MENSFFKFKDELTLEGLKFNITITNDKELLNFLNDNSPETNLKVIVLDRKFIIGLLYLIPEESVKNIFAKNQNCRKVNTFCTYSYIDKDNVHKFGFIQEFIDYNISENKMYLIMESLIDHTFNDKIQRILERFTSNKDEYATIYPNVTDYKDYQMHNEIGNVLVRRGFYNQALIEFRISLKMESNNAPAFYGIAEVYDNKNDIQKALKYYNKTKNIDPDYSLVHRRLGDLHFKLGNDDSAIEEYTKTITLTTDDLIEGYSHFSLGLLHEGKDKLKNAISHYKKAIKTRPDYDFAYYKLGCIYLKKGDMKKAIAHLEKASQLRPDKFMYYNYLALAYSSSGLYEKSIKAYKRLLLKDQNDVKTLLNLGYMYSCANDFKNTISYYTKALKINPENADIYYYVGLAYVTFDKSLDEALIFYKKALDINPKHVSSRNQVGLIYYMHQDYVKAIKEFQVCIRHDPGFSSPYKNLGLIYKELKKYKNSVDYYSKAIKLGENDFECYFNKALGNYNLENWKDAIEDFKVSIQLNPENELEINKFIKESEEKLSQIQ